MTDKLRAAAQALVDRWDSPQWGGSAEHLRHTGEYIADLRAALAEQPAEQVPVAWMREGWGPDCGPYVEFYRDDEMGWRDRKEWTPLYTAPQPAIPPGYKLVPVRMTQAMRDVTDSEGWDWADLLAAAESITEDEYAMLAAAPEALQPAKRVPLTDEQIEKIKAKPECWEHVGQRIEFRYRPFARAIEQAHGITGETK